MSYRYKKLYSLYFSSRDMAAADWLRAFRWMAILGGLFSLSVIASVWTAAMFNSKTVMQIVAILAPMIISMLYQFIVPKFIEEESRLMKSYGRAKRHRTKKSIELMKKSYMPFQIFCFCGSLFLLFTLIYK